MYVTQAQNILFEDDFESYDNFIIEDIGDYTLVDVDGLDTYSFNGVTFDNSGFPFAYIIFNSTATMPALAPNPGVSDWSAHSGDKALAAFASVIPGPNGEQSNDDWIITPAITLAESGNVFSFYAKASDATYSQENFNVAISTSGTDLEDFEYLAEDELPAVMEWEEFTYDLDEYAEQEVYLAIQHIGADQFGFMLDDFKVIADDLSVGEHKFAGFKHYLTQNLLHLSAHEPIKNIEIYNLLGQRVLAQSVNTTQTQIDMSSLNSAIYIAKVNVNNHIKSFKVTIR